MPDFALEDLYDEGDWGGHTNYECAVCPYANLDEGAARRHAASHLTNPPRSGLVRPDGTPIEPAPVVGPSSGFTRGDPDPDPEPGPPFTEPAHGPDRDVLTEPHPFTTDPNLTED